MGQTLQINCRTLRMPSLYVYYLRTSRTQLPESTTQYSWRYSCYVRSVLVRSSKYQRFVCHTNCTDDSECLAYESSQYFMCWYICFGLQSGWSVSCVNVICTVQMSYIHCGLCVVDFNRSEPKELLICMSSIQSELRYAPYESQGEWSNSKLNKIKKFF